MKIVFICAVAAMLLAESIQGQPQLPRFAADRTPLSPGARSTLYGQDLGPDQGCAGRPDPGSQEIPDPRRASAFIPVDTTVYPRQLCGVQVFVGGEAAGLLYVQAKQVDFKVPQNIPLEGAVEIKVVYQGLSSSGVQAQIDLDRPKISLEGIARVGGPVWIRVELPQRLGAVAYPAYRPPLDFGCNQLEVRRNGMPLARTELVSRQGIIGPGNGCGNDTVSPGNPQAHAGRLPLHLQYRFSTPGIYEVRYARAGIFSPKEISAQSEWTQIEILPAGPVLPVAAPQDPSEILSDYLPGILGYPNAATLSIVVGYIYHPDDTVRLYAEAALDWWPEAEVDRSLLEAIRTRGPSDEAMRRFSVRPMPEIIGPMIPYLQSDNPVLLRGALLGLGWQLRLDTNRPPGGAEVRAESAIPAAAERIAKIGDPQVASDLAVTLSAVRNERARDVLWSFVERGIAREQSLIAITWRKDPRDLPLLGSLLTAPVTGDPLNRELSSLPYALRNSYGDAALPFLEGGLQSGYAFVPSECARELVLAGRGSGFAFVARTIEGNERYKQELTQFIHDSFPETRGADEGALLAFLKLRAN